jgi:hypothetical protein
MRQCLSARRNVTAIDKNTSKVCRREDQLAAVQIKQGIFTLPRCKSAELLFSCCKSVAALALANCNELVAEANITAPAHTQRALHGAKIPIGKSGKITFVSGSGCTRACYRHFLFPVPNCHTEFLAFLRSSPPFFSFICSEQGEPEVLLKVLTLGEELVGARQRMSHTHHKQNGTAEARGLVPLGGGGASSLFSSPYLVSY